MTQRNTFTVTPQTLTTTPVSELLYGNFIELGYGIQVEPMWGEMLWNRSFEPWTPYKGINTSWYDLWHDENDTSRGYKTDWTHEDWYHSGYEHNAWFAAPGDEGPFHIDDNSRFLIENSPVLDVQIQAEPGGSGHGRQCLRLVNHETERWGGVAQAGKVLRPGETYQFRGRLQSTGSVTCAEVRFYPEGDWTQPLAVLPLGEFGEEWTKKTAAFRNEEFEGRAVFSLWVPPGADIRLDDFSLMPASARHGWRRDVVETARRIAPTVMRVPGGCFASFYDWRDGVGSYSERRPQPSYFWGGQNYNDVGTAELALLCKELGAEMMVCVKVFHPRKEKYEFYFSETAYGLHGYDFPEFTDIDEGAKLAADWVAYCNLPIGTHPMADLRARHGHPEPFGVRFWEMDNEVERWFGVEEYAHAVVTYARAMKAVDPNIEIGIVTYGESLTNGLEAMLEIAGADIDFLADRRTGEAQTRAMLDRMRQFNESHGTTLHWCETEWLPYNFEPDAFNYISKDELGGVTKSYLFSKWRYALNMARAFLMWQRLGGDVLFVNFNNFANTHSQCALNTPKEGAYLSAAGRMLELFSRSPAAWPLALAGYTPDERGEFQVQAAWDKDRKRLVLSVLNLTREARESVFVLSPLDRTFTSAQTSLLQADSLIAMNTLAQPDAIRRTDREDTDLNTHAEYTVAAPAYSYSQIVLSPNMPTGEIE